MAINTLIVKFLERKMKIQRDSQNHNSKIATYMIPKTKSIHWTLYTFNASNLLFLIYLLGTVKAKCLKTNDVLEP